MTGLGTPPPAELAGDVPAVAQWYADMAVQHGAHECTELPDLLSGAIVHAALAEPVRVPWSPLQVPLHSALAPYRRTPGGLAEQTERQWQQVLADHARPRGRALGRTERLERYL